MSVYGGFVQEPMAGHGTVDKPHQLVTVLVCDACGKIATGHRESMPVGWSALRDVPVEACSVECYRDLEKNPREYPRDGDQDAIMLALWRLKREAGSVTSPVSVTQDSKQWRCAFCKATASTDQPFPIFERDHAHEEAFK